MFLSPQHFGQCQTGACAYYLIIVFCEMFICKINSTAMWATHWDSIWEIMASSTIEVCAQFNRKLNYLLFKVLLVRKWVSKKHNLARHMNWRRKNSALNNNVCTSSCTFFKKKILHYAVRMGSYTVKNKFKNVHFWPFYDFLNRTFLRDLGNCTVNIFSPKSGHI